MTFLSLFQKSAARRDLLLLMTLLLICLPSDRIIYAQEYYDDYAQQQEQDDYAPQQPADNLYHDYAARHEAGNK